MLLFGSTIGTLTPPLDPEGATTTLDRPPEKTVTHNFQEFSQD